MQEQINEIIAWLQKIYADHPAVIAVSGGVDSAVSLTLLTRAIGKDKITALLLPYQNQEMKDAEGIVKFNGVRSEVIQIESVVEEAAKVLGVTGGLRKGNLMARVRMIAVYDRAKALSALVCGTENKSEHYLGYYTRFGDEASDVEPLRELYKTEVWEAAKILGIPDIFVTKAPSAGLWEGQTDENELGFSYSQADQVLKLLVDKKMGKEEIVKILKGEMEQEIVEKIIARVEASAFKHQVPYLRG